MSKWYYQYPLRTALETEEFLAKLGLTERSDSLSQNRIFRLFPNAPSSAWIGARTDRDGKSEVTDLKPGRCLVLLRQSGDSRSWDVLERANTGENQTIAFVRSREHCETLLFVDDWVSRVHGKVLDVETGEPVPRVNVHISGEAAGGDDTHLAISTLDDGTFCVMPSLRMGYGAFRLALKDPGRECPYELPEPIKGERKPGVPTPEIVLKLSKCALITGIVTDADGTPLDGVHIQREYPDKKSAMTLTTTDARGRYHVKHEGGVYRIRSSAAFWVDIVAEETVAQTEWAELELAPGESAVQDFVFPRTGRLVLNFISPGGTSVPGGVFRGQVVKYGSTTEVQPAGHTIALHNGKIAIPYLTAGRYEVEARVDGYDPVMLDNLIIGADGGDTEGEVTLTTSTLRQNVRVVHANGTPWPGVYVGAHEYYPFNAAGGKLIPSNNLSSLTGGKTDRNGEYVLENLWEGMFRIAAYDLRLPKYGLGVMVKLPHDGPVILQPEVERPRVPYAVKPIDLASNSPLDTQHHTTQVFAIGKQGYLEDGPAINGVTLPEGEHLVVFVKPGYTAAMKWVDVAPARSLLDGREVELEVADGGSVCGVIGTATGKPLSGQALLVYPAEIWDLAQWDSESWQRLGRALAQGATSGEGGTFELRFLPTGTYIVACDERAFSKPVEVRGGCQTGSVMITKDK